MWTDKLNEFKKQSQMTTQDIAVASKVPVGTLNKLFSGETKDPRLKTLNAVLAAMGKTIGDLYTDENGVDTEAQCAAEGKKKSAPSTAEADWTRDEGKVNMMLMSMPLEAKVRAVQFYIASRQAVNAIDADIMLTAARLLDGASGESLPKIELSEATDARVGRDIELSQLQHIEDGNQEMRTH